MVGRGTAEQRLAYLRELILHARAMPMSASCVINRGEVLAAIDEAIGNLPYEIADAQQVIDTSASKIAEGEEEAGRILAEAREHAAALRREIDEFIDARMASFESVLHKTTSQVRTARARLAERSGLDTGELPKLDRRTFAD
jgi:vacuolar-type H+-ATPase subunit H